ncbi:helix-turn-helix domain-containing protein, partial [Glycomyces luteolus]
MDFEVRDDRRPQGRRKLVRERAAYLQLVSEGYSNKAACKVVGVNPRTGERWRYGRNPVGKHQGGGGGGGGGRPPPARGGGGGGGRARPP